MKTPEFKAKKIEQEETMNISLSELREKNNALWEFVRFHIPYASGDLDKWLDIALTKIRYEKQSQ
jgi:hypothetical protein